MILSCNSCEKKFVVPDNAIGANGRLVQCSSCGNKWKQYPITKEIKGIKETKAKKKVIKTKSVPKKIQTFPKANKRKIKRRTGPDLYSPEYLKKKHGININSELIPKINSIKIKTKVSFGFYNFFIVFIVVLITSLRLIYFSQDVIVNKFPISEIYLNYLFESIRNIIEIINNFFMGY